VAYLTISTTIAYSLMIINEVITSAVLRNGPLPDFPTTLPDWRAFAVVLGGVGIRMIIVWARSRRESVGEQTSKSMKPSGGSPQISGFPLTVKTQH